jgi:HAD superfamily hydrolase (TIGR01549 family)
MIKAVIFDMDGVVSDTQGFHGQVESMLLEEHGIIMKPEQISSKYAGVQDEKMFAEIFEANGIVVNSIDDIILRKWEIMENTTRGKITAIPYAIDLIQSLKDNGFKLAIASASTKSFIDKVIDSLNVRQYFDVLVSSYEVAHGKPAPDIFLLAAKRLNVQPKEAIVIEDGRSGMIGATAAGMKSIGLIANTKNDYPATKLVSSLRDVSVDFIQRL